MRKLKVFSLVAVMLIFGMMALGSGSGSEKKEIVASEEVRKVYLGDNFSI